MIHELKILPEYFKAVISGEKTFEVRQKDRRYQKGDLIALNEFDGDSHTDNSCLVYIDYILDDERYCSKDMVIMSIKPCSVYIHTRPFSEFRNEKDYSVPLATKAARE